MECLKIKKKYLQMLKRAGGAQRVKMSFKLYRLARQIIKSAIRNEHQELSDKELEYLVNQRFLTNK